MLPQPFLPKADIDFQTREQQLLARRESYELTQDYVPPVPMLKKVPWMENFSLRYWRRRVGSFAMLPLNMVRARWYQQFHPLARPEDYRHLFKGLSVPALADRYRSDPFFAEQRLSGANPLSIRRLSALPEDFPVTDAHLQRTVGPGERLASALGERRLFLLEFPGFLRMGGGLVDGRRKYMPKPRALFCWRPGGHPQGGELRTVAILVKNRADQAGVLYTADDPPMDWLLAKLAVQVADGNHQELGVHFAHCHAVMAPFAVVTNRQLSVRHPVYQLLEPHFRFMLYDNSLGLRYFLNAGGPVDRFMAGTLEESLDFVRHAYKEWSLADAELPADLQNRGMDDAESLPHYPYRDDGLPIWQATERFIRAYLSLYYQAPQDLAQDPELQGWARELTDPKAGAVRGMPAAIETLDQLVRVLTSVIFTCGPKHSALNFAQWDYTGFVPCMPYASFCPVPLDKGADLETVMEFLPPYRLAADQLLWSELLTSYRHDRLGQYGREFPDPRAQEVTVQFQHDLDQIEQEIQARNHVRMNPYEYLRPSLIINSINT
jgi:arachidonate 15-lipoxygenase